MESADWFCKHNFKNMWNKCWNYSILKKKKYNKIMFDGSNASKKRQGQGQQQAVKVSGTNKKQEDCV